MEDKGKKKQFSKIRIGWSRISKEKGSGSRQGRKILSELLRRAYGVRWNTEEELGRGVKGKPYLPDHPEIHFNLSHSGEYVVCCIGDIPMGIDIQYHKAGKLERMAERLFTQEEKEEFERSGRRPEIFYKYWTKKESYLKYTGQGISCELSRLDYEGVRFRELSIWEGYSGMLCVPDFWNGEAEIIAEIV